MVSAQGRHASVNDGYCYITISIYLIEMPRIVLGQVRRVMQAVIMITWQTLRLSPEVIAHKLSGSNHAAGTLPDSACSSFVA